MRDATQDATSVASRRWSSCLGLAWALSAAACARTSLPAPAAPAPAPVAVEGGPAPPPVAVEGGPAPPPDATPDSSRRETLDERASRQLGRTWGWIFVGEGGVAGAVAIGTSVLMLGDKVTRDHECNAMKACSDSGLNANSQLAELAGWNVGAWILAAAGLGVGAYLLVVHPTDRAMGTEVGVVPNGSGASLSLRTAF